MNANDIIIGTKLEIEIPEYIKSFPSQTSSYISQLLDVADEKNITIAAPMSEGRYKYLSAGLNIVVYFLSHRQELMHFNATVKKYKKLGYLEAFDALITSEFKKIQRRMNYRLNTVLECKYVTVDDQTLIGEKPEFKEIPSNELKNALTKNISGSGVCLIMDNSYDSGMLSDISIDLEGMGQIRVLAQVIRSTSVENKKHEVGMNFIYISPQDLITLTKFIFKKQRLMLKNNPISKK